MSYYDEASLVMIPSGYKTSKVYSIKPTDGSGDLAFTRSNDTATRVGPDGLIEKVRTNLIIQSQDFTTSWATNAAPTITANTTVAPDGTTTADTIASSGSSSGAYQVPTVASGVEYSFSVYVKNITNATTVQIGCDLSPSNGTISFNAVTGALIGGGAGITGSSVTDAGNGWYRVSGTYVSTGTTNTFIVFGQSGMSFAVWGAQLEAGVTTDYIATTSAAVSVGPVANVPRLDYLNSSCPRLLLEPQRTNIAIYSEQFDNPSGWTLYNGTQVANTTETLDPSGYYGAEKVTMGGTNSATYRKTIGGLTNGDTYTFSLYIKQGSGVTAFLDICDASTTPDITPTSSWVRYTKTGVWNTTLNFVDIELRGTSGSYCYIWGAQLELGAYATSYIPTLGAAVTRGADTCSKTGISSLIGQTEGTLFLELDIVAGSPVYHTLMQVYGDIDNRVAIGQDLNSTNVFLYINASGSASYQITTTPAGHYKIALAYKNGDVAMYINGVSAITSSRSVSFGTALTTLFLNNVNGNEIGIFKDSQALLFKTRLSNADLAALTA